MGPEFGVNSWKRELFILLRTMCAAYTKSIDDTYIRRHIDYLISQRLH